MSEYYQELNFMHDSLTPEDKDLYSFGATIVQQQGYIDGMPTEAAAETVQRLRLCLKDDLIMEDVVKEPALMLGAFVTVSAQQDAMRIEELFLSVGNNVGLSE